MAGIYIHIPFCKQKCTYCDFHFSTNFSTYRTNMLDCMLKELELRSVELKDEQIETIYFGGGTPSLLNSTEILAFIEKVKSLHQVSKTAEITLEANPDDISQSSILEWKNAGINRLSIGIQSFDNEDLTWMNRAHNSDESLKAVKICQEAGISNISIDLIYGLPNMDVNRWEKQLNLAISLNVSHISAYCLTVEEKTALHKLVETKKILPAENELQALHFELLQKKLKEADFIQYEISNFGKEGFFSKHNSSYWKGEKYQGIGPSAHSFDRKTRSWNIANNPVYIKKISENILPSEIEILSNKDFFNEMLLIGLRTIWGVSLDKLNEIEPPSAIFTSKINKLLSENKAEIKNQQLILNSNGMLFADSIAQDLFL